MLKKSYLTAAALSLACLLVVADSAHAQRRGFGGFGGYGGGYGVGRGWGGNNWSQYVAPFTGGGYGNGYYGNGYYGGYGNGFYGNYGSPYYSGYRSGYYYPSNSYVMPSYDYSYAPSYSTSPSYSYGSSYQPSYSESSTQQSQPNNAQIRVLVPDPQAKVTFDGNPTQQTGTERWFYTPALQSGTNNTYRIRATWMQNGREMTQERVVNVNPGQGVTVEFRQTDGSQEPAPAPLPKKTENSTTATTLDGHVIRTGPDNFVIQSPNQGEVTIYTNPQTRYMMNNNPGAFTDIRVGSNVNFGYSMQGDRRFANTVTIRP